MLYGNLLTLTASVLCSVLLTRWVRDTAVARGWTKPPEFARHIHRRPVPRLGGVAVLFSVLCVVAAALLFPGVIGSPIGLKAEIAGILGPAILIFLLGLWDDIKPLRAPIKFSVQAIAGVLLYAGGFGVRQIDLFFGSHVLRHFVALPLTIFWVLLITNAFNLIDGLDGLAAGSALFSTGVVFVVALVLGNHLVSFLALVLGGAILGFLPFNFNRATIFLGDSGSLFIGFMLCALGLAGSEKAQTMVAVAIPVVTFGLPILDVVLAVVRRFLNGKPLFVGDREHIHHKLLDRGLGQRHVVLILYGVTAGFSLLSLALLHGQEVAAGVLAVVGLGVCLGVQRLRYDEFAELRSVAQRTLAQKRTITNNLYIRHTAEPLRSCEDFPSLCKILSETLLPLGFDGFDFTFPGNRRLAEVFLATQNSDSLFGYGWRSNGLLDNALALKILLMSSAGQNCGFLWLYRKAFDKPLLLDVNLLTGGFQIAVGDALQRCCVQAIPAMAEEHETEQVALSAGA